MRYLEQSAVAAAADLGYGSNFHREHGSAWVIHRMTLLMDAPTRPMDELQLTTWISHFARVRGGREYIIENVRSGKTLYRGLAEWVYIDRRTLAPRAIPADVMQDFDVPGAPLHTYDAPEVSPVTEEPRRFTIERTAEWHECDSMGHVNNANYADWLDDAAKAALEAIGWPVEALRQRGLHLRAEYCTFNYKRASLPGDRLRITTQIDGVEGRVCALSQIITTTDGAEVHTSSSIYGWRDARGELAAPPEGWGIK